MEEQYCQEMVGILTAYTDDPIRVRTLNVMGVFPSLK